MSSELTTQQETTIVSLIEKQKMTAATYKVVLAQTPPQDIVKTHPYGKFDYLPVTAVERLLDGLFEAWKVEVLREGAIVNGFYVVVRLTAKIPGSDMYMTSEGIGAAEFQTSKGAAPTDFTSITTGAIVTGVPKAKAEAIKNAAKAFGNIFGRNLARDDDNAIAEAEVVNKSRSKIANTLSAAAEKEKQLNETN